MRHPDEGTIHAWLDGALPPDEGARLEAHVAECAECATLVAEARGLVAAASRILTSLDDVPAGVLPGEPAPGDVRPLRPATRGAPARRPFRTTPGLAAAAALLLVAGIGGALMLDGADERAAFQMASVDSAAVAPMATPTAAPPSAPSAIGALPAAPEAASAAAPAAAVGAAGNAASSAQLGVVAAADTAGPDAAVSDAAADAAPAAAPSVVASAAPMAALARPERTATPAAPPPPAARDAAPFAARKSAEAPARGALAGQVAAGGAGAGAPVAAAAPQVTAPTMDEAASRVAPRDRAEAERAGGGRAETADVAAAADAMPRAGARRVAVADPRPDELAGCWEIASTTLRPARPGAPRRMRLTADRAPDGGWVVRPLPGGAEGRWTRDRGEVTLWLRDWPSPIRLVFRPADGAMHGDGTVLRRAGC